MPEVSFCQLVRGRTTCEVDDDENDEFDTAVTLAEGGTALAAAVAATFAFVFAAVVVVAAVEEDDLDDEEVAEFP